MRLKTKVVGTGSVMLAVSTLGLGALAISFTYEKGLENLSSELDALVALIEDSSDPVSAAMFELDGLNVNVQFREEDGTSTYLQEVFSPSTPESTISREVNLGYGEALIISKSTKSVENLLNGLYPIIIFASIVLAISSAFVLYLALYGDLKRISDLAEFARGKSAGKPDPIVVPGGSDEIKDFSQAFSDMVFRLEENQRNLRNFLSDSSHELKTPLTVIRGYTEILQSELKDSDAQNRLQKIHVETMKMQNLVSDLLFLSEIESYSSIQLEQFDLCQVVLESIEAQKVLEPNREFRFHSPKEEIVLANKRLIERFITNALNNIRLHTSSKTTGYIEIKEFGAEILLIIEDDGPGLPQEIMESSNTRFHPHRSETGTGLGLSIMRGIIRRHNQELMLTQSSRGGLRISTKLSRAL